VVKIVWTEISIHDLKEIFEYIAEDSEKYASITSLKIYSRVQDIIGNPHIGRIVPELNKKDIREIIEGKYRIIYQIKNENQVDILRVFHSARLLRKKSIR
jgi:addiction module RelE/StbE family toxin